jgi:hypothetical protein
MIYAAASAVLLACGSEAVCMCRQRLLAMWRRPVGDDGRWWVGGCWRIEAANKRMHDDVLEADVFLV